MEAFLSKESKVSKILQWVSLFTIISAFLGFIIVNSYLAIYDFWDFNFLKVQYFSAGGLFLFFIAVPSVSFYSFLKAKRILEDYRNENKSTIKSILVFLTQGLIFVFFASLSLIIFVLPVMLGKVINSTSFIYSLGILWVTLIFLSVRIATKSHEEIIKTSTKPINLRNILVYFGAHYRLLYFIFAIPLLIFIFSLFVYISVPRYLGGGKPVSVSISLNSNLNAEEIEAKSPFNAIMVYESENSVLVVIDGGTYLIKQSNISYIKYLNGTAKIRGLQNLDSVSELNKN